MKPTTRLDWIVPGDPAQNTGGYRYDARIVDGLRQRGWQVVVHGLAGRFPQADRLARDALSDTLASLPDHSAVVIDGLALGGLPEVVAAERQRLQLLALVHHPLADEMPGTPRRELIDSEQQALAACRAVAVTSPFTARRLAELLNFSRPVAVIEPGVEPCPPAISAADLARHGRLNRPARWLCVGSLTPRKGHAVLLEALTGLDGAWTLSLVGSPSRDPQHAAELKRQASALGLEARLQWLDELDDADLAQAYSQADLCLVPSLYEGYGMVVSEALARGVALISTTGGALAETVPDDAALKVAPSDPAALHQALASWLGDAQQRQQLAQAALAHRSRLTDWTCSTKQFARWLEQVITQQEAR